MRRAPARFSEDSRNPVPLASDGSIYGQVFPVSANRLELHYFALWDRDCGRNSHPFDVEHVSALVSTEGEPTALYWYAGAHEKTMCDISSAATAAALDAQSKGPRVWSSSGKHAFYFSREMCRGGCGADTCDDNVEFPNSGPVINLGEVDAPATVAPWITSSRWPLAARMNSDFSPQVLAIVDSAPISTPITTVRGSRVVRGTIQGSDDVLSAATTGANHTGSALDTANGHTSRSLGKATRATGRSLARAWRAVFSRKKE